MSDLTFTGAYTCTHHTDSERTACPVCSISALATERDQLRSRCDQLIESQRLAESAMQEQFARADKAKVELGLWQEGCIVREEDRAELAAEREKVRELRECLKENAK